ncbi:MAG: hypothetical protein KJ914_02610 [Gammaproteobacteria bacterium]|nr:hypothetical protein [Gammaproteobacteria bacterium]MBU1722613.1 hypothetical protein [Gammaproteobacteria bacterium]MBU2007085.1 hypothetical protein [Gammaproteobacteria bacterium]
MSTTGYSLAASPIVVDGISLLESMPPQCQVNFHIDVVGAGHVLETSHSIDGHHITIFVTHIRPERIREKSLQRLNEAVNLGVLEPGPYVVTFFNRGDDGNFSPVKALVLRALGEEDAQIPPDHSHDWHAWVNAMPPGPSALHVSGTVTVPNGDTLVKLVRAVPQGFNPRILILDLERHDATASTSSDTEVRVHYSEAASVDSFDSIHIRFPNGGNVFIDNIIVAY